MSITDHHANKMKVSETESQTNEYDPNHHAIWYTLMRITSPTNNWKAIEIKFYNWRYKAFLPCFLNWITYYNFFESVTFENL